MRIVLERGVAEYEHFVYAFEEMLHRRWKWGEWEHDECHDLIDELWEAWHELKADLPNRR